MAASALSAVSVVPAQAADVVTAAAAGVALDLPAGVSVSGFTGADTSRAVADTTLDSSTDFNDFPSQGTSYVMLSTGNAEQVFGGVPSDQLSTDVGNDGQPDTASMQLTVDQGTAGAGCLIADFALGTEERLGYTDATPDDGLSVEKDGENYAYNAGRGYFRQDKWPSEPKRYEVYDLNYWHQPGDPFDPALGTIEDPRLPEVTRLNNVTTRDTVRVPLDPSADTETVTFSVHDAINATNGDLDTVAFVDHVRLEASCWDGTGVEPRPNTREAPNSCCGVIRGNRAVGSPLTFDPIPSTPGIEDTLTAPDNGWQSPSDTRVELRFRWYRATSGAGNSGDMTRWSEIPGADRQTYVPRATDRGKQMIVLVTGLVDGRRPETFPSTSTASTWFVTLPIENGTFLTGEAPTVNPTSGMKVGETVTAQIGRTVPRQDTYDWQWYMRAPGATTPSLISGQTAQSIVVPAVAAGKILSVRATARRASFDSRTFEGSAQGAVAYDSWSDTPKPTIVDDGSPRNGETLSVRTGDWSPTPSSYSYQWKRGGAVINGATSATYELRAADVGLPVTVDVSGVLAGYPQQPQTSDPVTPEGIPMGEGNKPTITGQAAIGEILTGGPRSSEWDPSTATLTYGWYVGSTLKQSGSSRTFSVPAEAAGKRIYLLITARKTGYTTTTVVSDPTAVVPRGTITVGTVRVLGTPRVGGSLQALATSWKPSPVTYAYRWTVGGRVVSRQTKLRLTKAMRGKRVTLTVTGSKSGFTSKSRSVSSATVRAS